MYMKLLAILLLLFVTGCSKDVKVHHAKVSCDNGFTTGFMQHAKIDDGVIMWSESAYSPNNYLRMPEGVLCTTEYTTEEFLLKY